MSDQNFVDEEVKGKKKNNTGNAKRKKSLIIDAKGNDQVIFDLILYILLLVI